MRLKTGFVLFVVLLLLVAGCNLSSDSKTPAPGQDSAGEELQDYLPEAAEIKISASGELSDGMNTFFYVDKNGGLRQRNIEGTIDNIIVAGNFFIEDYDVHTESRLIALVVRFEKPDVAQFVLYNADTGDVKVLGEDAIVGAVKWSPNGKYLVLDRGTYIWRNIEIYNTLTQTLTPLDVPVGEYAWSPDGSRLLADIQEFVEPPTPVSAGESSTAALVEISDDLDIQILLEGTSEYWITVHSWQDDDSVLVKKINLEDGQEEYLMITLESGDVTIAKPPKDTPVPDDISLRLFDVSADQKHVLYEENGLIQLWNVETGERVDLCEGTMAKWNKS